MAVSNNYSGSWRQSETTKTGTNGSQNLPQRELMAVRNNHSGSWRHSETTTVGATISDVCHHVHLVFAIIKSKTLHFLIVHFMSLNISTFATDSHVFVKDRLCGLQYRTISKWKHNPRPNISFLLMFIILTNQSINA